ncbi:hypothetical protein HK405_012496 [Cladochytrium tenue]|nr:hypothetical protein HK405_012496 [Cladochytrium tenue]
MPTNTPVALGDRPRPPPPPLPSLVLSAVFSLLTGRDAARAARVCHAWAAAARPVLFASLGFRQDGGPLRYLLGKRMAVVSDLRALQSLSTWVWVGSGGVPQSVLGYVRHLTLDYANISILKYLAHAGVQPTSLRISSFSPTGKINQISWPIGARVSRLSLPEHSGYTEKLVDLFPGPLTHLEISTVGKALLARNRSSLRSLAVLRWDDDSAVSELIEFFDSKPPLRVLSISQLNITNAPAILRAIQTGCGQTLTEFRLDYPRHGMKSQPPNADLLISFISGLSKLEKLTISLGQGLGESNSTNVWPPIRILILDIYSASCLAILAGVTSTVRSLRLEFMHAYEGHETLQLALNNAGAAGFRGLRDLAIAQWGGRQLSAAQLSNVVACCPNLETLDLRVYVESLRPLEALASLQFLNIYASLTLYRALIEEVVDLVLQRDDGAVQTKPLQAFVYSSPARPENSEPAQREALAMRNAVKDAEARTGGRLQFMIDVDQMPVYF